MDTPHFDRLVRRIPELSRRGMLAAMSALGFELWRSRNGSLEVDARCKPKGDKKTINKKGYVVCIDGEQQVVGAVQYCRLRKQGLTGGKCPSTEPPPA